MSATAARPRPSVAGPVTPAERMLDAYRLGHSAQLVTGRSLYDLVTDRNGLLLTVMEHLRREARARHGMHTVTYSLAQGLDWDSARIQDDRDRSVIESALRAHGLVATGTDGNEVIAILRGIASLARTRSAGLKWADQSPLGFLLLLEFADHLTPSGEGMGRTDQEIAAVEVAHILGQSNALRRSGNLLVFHGRAGRVDGLVVEALHPVRLKQPDQEEKCSFVQAVRRIYPSADFEDGLSDAVVARLTANTPNRGLEVRLRASELGGEPVILDHLLTQKSEDVSALSEGTLSILDTRRISGVRLVGRNIATPQSLLLSFGQGILDNNPLTPANVILVGPPGSGKTDLALQVAERARASAYQIHSPKGGIVGETERRAGLMTKALSEWTPNVAFADEITEMLPTERADFDGDSGASRAVIGALLTTLSDESRRGRSLLIGTTNCPWRMGAAMRGRFTVIPVLSPLLEDYPGVVIAVATRLAPEAAIAQNQVIEAARLFYDKGASPREILGAISLSLTLGGPPSAATILEAAVELCPGADRASAEYADLWAVKACGSQRMLPWYRCAGEFPFPSHLAGLVHPGTGELDGEEMDRRIEALKPHANL